jgi:hypothetical protein
MTRRRRRGSIAVLGVVCGTAVAANLAATKPNAGGRQTKTPNEAIRPASAGVQTPAVGAVVPRSAASATDAGPRAIAISTPARWGDPAPTSITAVNTTYRAAVTSIDGRDDVRDAGAQPVDVISMIGHFAASQESAPLGAAVPTGEDLTITIDQTTGEIVEAALSQSASDLSALGSVTSLNTP